MSRWLGSAVVVTVLAVLALAGCGGGGSPGVQTAVDVNQIVPAPNPFVGNYVFFGVGEENFVAITRVRPNGKIVSVIGSTSIWGNFIARGTVSNQGATSLIANHVRMRDNSVGTVTLVGNLGPLVGGFNATGTYQFSNGSQGVWAGRKWGNASNTGSWTYEVPAPSAQAAVPYNYTKAFGMIGRQDGQQWLVLVFEGKSTVYPCEGVWLIPGPELRPLGVAMDIYGAGISLYEPRADWYLDNNAHRPKITITARDLRLGGSVSGSFSGALMCYDDGKPEITMTSANFANVPILYRIPTNIVPTD